MCRDGGLVSAKRISSKYGVAMTAVVEDERKEGDVKESRWENEDGRCAEFTTKSGSATKIHGDGWIHAYLVVSDSICHHRARKDRLWFAGPLIYIYTINSTGATLI